MRWRRWSAVIVGFVGVLMVIQPHPGDLNAWTWLALAGTVIGCFRDVFARCLPVGVPTLVVSFTTALIVAVVGCGWAPGRRLAADERAARSASSLGSSLLLALGYQFVIIALRSGGEFSVIGAFRYASILWALAHRLCRVGRRAQRAGDGRHRRDRGVRPLHPPPRARAPLMLGALRLPGPPASGRPHDHEPAEAGGPQEQTFYRATHFS